MLIAQMPADTSANAHKPVPRMLQEESNNSDSAAHHSVARRRSGREVRR